MKNVLLNIGASALCVGALTIASQTIMAQTNVKPATVYEAMPSYSGEDLELAILNNGSYSFKLWSPMAEDVKLNIYNDGAGGKAINTYELKPDKTNGVWSVIVNADLMDKFYTFQIKKNGKWLNETPGVWAKAVGVNGNRAAIIDFAKTNPKGWENDKGPKVDNITDVVLYEMHHRDFSVHKN